MQFDARNNEPRGAVIRLRFGKESRADTGAGDLTLKFPVRSSRVGNSKWMDRLARPSLRNTL